MPDLDDLSDPLTAETPCEEAVRRIALHCSAQFSEALAVVMDSTDPRGPHKARVALRRLTTALDVFEPALRRKRRAALRARIKALFRALGDLRDSDVHLAARDGEPGHKDRLRRNAEIRHHLRATLADRRAGRLAEEVAVLVATDGPLWRRSGPAVSLRAAPLGQVAADMLGAVWAECQRHGASVSAMDPDDRHRFRKDLKAMRYLAEFFAPLFPALQREPFRSDFREIQDALGNLNDWEMSLALEGARRPVPLPPRQTRALVAAEAIWLRLASSPLPWGDPAAAQGRAPR